MSLVSHPSKLQNGLGQAVRFAFVDKRPPLQATVLVADAFRSAVLAVFHSNARNHHSFLLSGRHDDGALDRDHKHAYYLPEPALDGSPSVAGLVVVAPASRFSEEEIAALRAVTRLKWNGPSTAISLEFIGIDDGAVATVASRWTSSTPYVPLRRFWGTHGKRHLTPDKQFVAELRDHPIAADIVSLDVRPWVEVRVRVAPSAIDKLPRRRQGFRVTFTARTPLCSPIALGHSCHFGLGQFKPVVG
jgi:CRISPR-associated protein Csb2